jgi:hypothetical protein
VAAAALYGLALLTIGIREDWRLLHEDNGAFHTTLALSHLRLGLGATRAHDLFYEPATGHSFPYGHHPPALALTLASAFALMGSDAPWVARSVAIAFHLGSLLLFAGRLRRHLPPGAALAGLFVFATLPMSSFFGRMVDYEPLGLFAALLALSGFDRLLGSGWSRGLGLLLAGVVLGGLVDWSGFFFAGSIAAVAAYRAFRGEPGAARAAVAVAAAAAAVLALDVAHLVWANHGSFDRLREVMPGRGLPTPPLAAFALGLLERYRRYFTLAGLDASILTAVALAAPRSAFARRVFGTPRGADLRSLLLAIGGAAAAYVLAAPFWAAKHAYWQFYFLPYTVFAIVLAARLLWSIAGRWRAASRVAVVVFGLELVATSAYVLAERHTKTGEYAVAETARLRARFLVPASAGGR